MQLSHAHGVCVYKLFECVIVCVFLNVRVNVCMFLYFCVVFVDLDVVNIS